MHRLLIIQRMMAALMQSYLYNKDVLQSKYIIIIIIITHFCFIKLALVWPIIIYLKITVIHIIANRIQILKIKKNYNNTWR